MIEGTTSIAHITGDTVLQPAIRAWEIYLRDQGRSIYTVRSFSGDLNLFATFLTPGSALNQVNTGDINRFIQWLQTGRGVPCSPKSLARRITSVKSFFRWLNRCGVLSADPAEKVLQQSAISPLPEVLTAEEEEKALKKAMDYMAAEKTDARPYVLLALLLETGIKKGECLSITRNHIDKDTAGGPVLFIRYSNVNARLKERNIYLTPEWIKAYEQYLEQYQPEQQIFPWSPRRLEYLLEEISQKAEVKKHISFDMCRWTCALKDWNSGVEKDTIRQKLGISKIQWREISRKLSMLAGETASD